MNFLIKFFLVFLYSLTLANAETFRAYTEIMPPYNYKKDDKVVGLSTSLLETIMKKIILL